VGLAAVLPHEGNTGVFFRPAQAREGSGSTVYWLREHTACGGEILLWNRLVLLAVQNVEIGGEKQSGMVIPGG